MGAGDRPTVEEAGGMVDTVVVDSEEDRGATAEVVEAGEVPEGDALAEGVGEAMAVVQVSF